MTKDSDETERGEIAGWRSYRCPVCGHADEVDVTRGESARIRCSHCGTLLDVSLDKEADESVSVQLAEPEDGGEGTASP